MNIYSCSYYVGGSILGLLLSLTINHLARQFPSLENAVAIVALVVLFGLLFPVVIKQDSAIFKASLFIFFILGLGGILAWS